MKTDVQCRRGKYVLHSNQPKPSPVCLGRVVGEAKRCAGQGKRAAGEGGSARSRPHHRARNRVALPAGQGGRCAAMQHEQLHRPPGMEDQVASWL